MFDAAEGRYGDAEAVVNEVVDRDQPSLDGNSYLVAVATTALADWRLSPTPRRDERAGHRHCDAVDQVDGKPSSTTDGSRPWSSSCTATTPWPSSNACAAGPTRRRGRSWQPPGNESASATTRLTHDSATPKRSWPVRQVAPPRHGEPQPTPSAPPAPSLRNSAPHRC